MDFVHLHVHSEYSLLESTCRIEQLVKTARERGYKALALTDKNVLYGAIPFYKACMAHGIKPIIGMEVTIASELLANSRKRLPNQEHRVLLLAKNMTGYRHLIKISTEIQMSHDQQIQRQDILKYKDGLFILSAGPSGDIEQTLIETNNREKAKNLALQYKKAFGEAFYIEIEDHGLASEKQLKLEMVKIANELDIPLVAGNDVHHLNREDAKALDVLLSIKSGHKLEDNDRFKYNSDEYFLKSAIEMVEAFQHIPESITNTQHIANACHIEFSFNQPRLPKYPVSAGQTKDYLMKLCIQGLKERYDVVEEKHHQRLNHELEIIDQMGFNDYFLIVSDFINYARANGIYPGPGRGSAAGSIVAYVLRITDVDPLKYGLLFERFLNPERVTMPDIDIDFPDIHRDRVIQYVSQKYGEAHVAQIITFGTLAAKAVIRDVGKVLDLKSGLIDKTAKFIPTKPGVTIEVAMKDSEPFRQFVNQNPEVGALITLAKTLEGVPRHTSTHAAGVVISESPLTDIVPLQAGHDGVYLTQYPMETLEELGLLKMDFLGLRNLTLIENIIQLIAKKTGEFIQVGALPLNDGKTFELLSKGDTTGIFQLEAEGVRDVLRRLEPNDFEDIVAVNALNRPGPMSFIPQYIDSKHGRREVTYPHPDLQPVLSQTYGVIVYQEQIMQIASVMAGFSLGQADILRRAVSKKKRETLEEQQKYFVDGCIRKGYTKATAESIYELIVRFADYGFNRSHAVAYSIIAYQLAYLKANYPVAFMTALLSSAMNHTDRLMSYVRECRDKNIPLYLPSINQSNANFKMESSGIRFGLNVIKNVGYQAVQEIVQQREKRPYKSLVDFCTRVSMKKVNRRAMEALIFAGAFDEFGIERASLVATLEMVLKQVETIGHGQGNLFEEDDDQDDAYRSVPPFNLAEKLQFEKEALGFYLSAHPLEQYRNVLQQIDYTPIDQLNFKQRQTSIGLVVYVEKIKQIKTKKGQYMAFLNLSDMTDMIEAVVFPNVYSQLSSLLQVSECLLIEGNVEGDEGKKIVLQKAKRLSDVRNNPVLFLKIENRHQKSGLLHPLQAILKRYSGQVQVILYYEEEGKTVKLPKAYAIDGSEASINELINLLGERNVQIK